jgi:hypothetical protein
LPDLDEIGRHAGVRFIFPKQLSRTNLGRVDVSDAVRRATEIRIEENAIGIDYRIPMEARLLTIAADVILPSNITVGAIERVKRACARADEEKLARDRGRCVNSPARVELPRNARRAFCRRLDCGEQDCGE